MPGFLDGLFAPKRVEATELVLPYPIRDHLRYDSRLPKELVRSLVRDGTSEREGFENLALYLAFKASAGDPDLEKDLLRGLAAALKEKPSADDTERASLVRTFVEGALARIPGEWTVEARNLARISRHGFRFTDERYRTHARRLAEEERDVFIVGHAMFVGLASFIDEFARHGKRLYILIPAFMADIPETASPQTRNHTVGYVVDPDGSVRDLSRADLAEGRERVVVDDVRRTGKTEAEIRRYFEALSVTGASFEPLSDASGE